MSEGTHPLQEAFSKKIEGGQTLLEDLEGYYESPVYLHLEESPEGLGSSINEYFSKGDNNRLVIITSSTDLARALGRVAGAKYDEQEMLGTADPRQVVEGELRPELRETLVYRSLGPAYLLEAGFQIGILEVKLKTPGVVMQH